MRLEAPGSAPCSLEIVPPSVTELGIPFDVSVAVLDSNGYPSLEAEGTLHLSHPSEGKATGQIPFRAGVPAVGKIHGLVLGREGFHRLRTEMGALDAWSHPTRVSAEAGARLFWGDPHVHTLLSRCHADKCRSLNFCYTAARHAAGMEWVAAADHVSNGRCDVSKWYEQRCASELYNDPGEFVTLPAYEASLKGGKGGDTNVYMRRWPELFVDEYEEGDVRSLCRELEKILSPEEFFVVPHHTTRPGKHGEIPDEIYPGQERMPVMEIHSKWGTSEYRGNPNPLKKIHPGPSYANDLLQRGLLMGFVGGTDTHTTMPSGLGEEPGHLDRLPGMTAVWGEELTREEMYRGIQGRSCYATSLERIYLCGTACGVPLGGVVALEEIEEEKSRQICADVAGRSEIERVELVRNGEAIGSRCPDDWQACVEFLDETPLEEILLPSKHLGRFSYYYLRVTCRSGAQAWSSPVWIVERR